MAQAVQIIKPLAEERHLTRRNLLGLLSIFWGTASAMLMRALQFGAAGLTRVRKYIY